MTKQLLMFTVVLLFASLWGSAQQLDKKFITASQEPQYDYAPRNNYIGHQVNASRANLFAEGLNGGAVPTGWSVVDVLGTAGEVTFVTTSSYPSGYVPTESTHMARFNSYDAGAGNNTRLQQTTSFSTVGYNNVKVNFDWLMDVAYSGNLDSMYVQWSTDGTTWTKAGGLRRYSPTTGWTAQSITLPAGANGQSTLYIGFLFVSKYGNNCHMDNIVVTADPVLANDLAVTQWNTPTTSSNVNPSDTVRVTVMNNGTADASNFDIFYSVDGGNSFVSQNVAGTLAAGNDSMYKFTTPAALTAYTTYNCVAAVTLSSDGNHNNDTLTANIVKMLPVYTDTVYPLLQPLWTGTVSADSIVDSSYVTTMTIDTLVGWMKFDITSIPEVAQIQSVVLNAFVNADNFAYFRVMSLEYDPMAYPYDTIYNDTRNGSTYYTYNANFPSPGWFVGNLGVAGANDFKNRLTDDWFGVGLYEYETSAGYYLEFDGWNEPNVPYLVLTYQMPLSIDAALTGVTSPVTGYNPSSSVTITIKNLGTDPITEIPVSYNCNATTANETTPVGDTLYLNDVYTYTFTQPLDVTAVGLYNLTASVAYPGDIMPANDEFSYSFTKYEPFYPMIVNFDVSAISGSYGPEYMNGQYLLSNWSTNAIALLNNDGSVDTILTVSGATSFRDLARDSNYLYAGSNTAFLTQDSLASDTFFMVNNAATATFVRGSAFDPQNNGVWICNWNAGTENLLLVDKITGATIQTMTNPNAGLYGFGGLAYDYWTPGGPYLVGTSQHNHYNQLVWLKISDGSVLVDHDVTQDIPEAFTSGAISGGAFCSDEAVPGSVVLGGVIQNFSLFGYEIASTNFATYTIPGQLSSTIDSTTKTIEVEFPYGAVLTNVAPSFTLSDYHNLAEAYNLGTLQASGVNTFTLNDGDTINYYVVRMNYDNTDSVYSDWKVIISMEDPYLTITPATQSVTDAAGTVDFTITSNVTWTATSNQTWCTVTSSGTGNGTLTADYDANSTASTRTATIIVTSSTLADTATLVQGPSGIENEELVCIIYPNPSDGIYHLSINGAYNLQVYNLVGEMIFSDKMYDSYVLNLSHMPAGSYLLRLTSDEGTLNYKLILN